MKLAMPVIAALALIAAFRPAGAQPPSGAPPAAAADSALTRRLRLHLDCSSDVCDFDFLKRELAWVDWVRDRADADVHVLLTTRDTGAGGSERTLYVMRPRGDGPAADTLRVFSPPTASTDARRRQIARALAAALARDVVTRPEGEGLRVSVGEPAAGAPPAAAARDPWNHWVYKLSTDAYVNGESSYRSAYVNTTVSATRVTDPAKLGFSVSQNFNENLYRFEDGSHFTSITRSWSGRGVGVRSLSRRWSAGASASVYSSSFSNVNWSAGVGPAIEFDVWPYDESSRRSLTFGYQLHGSHVDYLELTLFGRTAESLFSHELNAGLSLRQSWGSLDLSATGSQYLHDGSKYRLSTYTQADLKLWRGLSITGYAYAARVHDQLSLRRGDAPDSEVISRLHQLATSYQYTTSFGISYRFGSIFDSVVNQRLEGTLGSL